MINAIVACSVILSLGALYCLARLPDIRSAPARRGSSDRIRRLLRIAIRRAAHRDAHWLTTRELERRQ
jgi:hypothetical protein